MEETEFTVEKFHSIALWGRKTQLGGGRVGGVIFHLFLHASRFCIKQTVMQHKYISIETPS